MDFSSSEVFPQIVISLIIVSVIFFVYIIVEQIYRAWFAFSSVRIPILNCTASSGVPIPPSNTILPYSENQLTGIEFSYTGFVYISSDTDDGTDGWRTIFYKGYTGTGTSMSQLLAPGVFVSSANSGNSSPTLRVVMNTYDNWFNTIDVDQIPFNKWFHLAIVLRKNSLEVYINGNLASKKSFNGTLPYQNYEPLNIFPNMKTPTTVFDNTQNNPTSSSMGIPPGESMTVNGKFSGFLSNLYYFSYAVTYSEIQAMLNMGPSSSTCSVNGGNLDQPPYLIDTWWTQQKN